MGLLSALSVLFQIGVLIHDDYQNSNIKKDSKERATQNNQHTYIDSHGNEYDIRTGKKVTFTIDHGDKVYRDTKTWKIVRNISADERTLEKENNREKAIKECRRFFYDPEKKLYCEIETGEYYKRFDDIRMSFRTRYCSIKDNRTVYEFNEGPTDKEIARRAELYRIYCEAEKTYTNYGSVNWFDYEDGINSKEYIKKNLEKMNLLEKKRKAEEDVLKYDKMLEDKYHN